MTQTMEKKCLVRKSSFPKEKINAFNYKITVKLFLSIFVKYGRQKKIDILSII